MKILIVNPILYTSETADIPRVDSVRDSMITGLCSAFAAAGHDVTLAACDRFRPLKDEGFPFDIRWFSPFCPAVCKPHVFPVLGGFRSFWRREGGTYDLVISGEVFSANTLFLSRHAASKLIIWQELAKHNRLGKTVPSRIWYGVIARLFMRKSLVVARSVEARTFISRYMPRVAEEVIDHGTDLARFVPAEKRGDHFIICSQLIPRKRVDLSIERFARYRQQYDRDAKLIIAGEGECREELEALSRRLLNGEGITFTGKLDHERMIPLLASARALLVSTEKDNNMVSVVESIAVGTPVITTSVPYNAGYIREFGLGIVDDAWDERALDRIVREAEDYRSRCLEYRKELSCSRRVEQFLAIAQKYLTADVLKIH